ncbi:hypothetical protein [Tautonia plasticadhaerens]|uniref:Uncharacterized protein n=1 Tax=Tautonia plasticadhaerens TaxID=2527974 RepID=A0A518GXJ0_9BACT|nr:hypothetical protein [Tautonia plasticadhaerens]QDV33301.1 hypothetical protein ElP_11440 [Tautonia plasticadhaerens]
MKPLPETLSALGLLAALSIGLAGCGGGGDAGIDEGIDVSDPAPIEGGDPVGSADPAAEEVDPIPVDPEPADPGFGDPGP